MWSQHFWAKITNGIYRPTVILVWNLLKMTPKRSSCNEMWCVVINHIYMLYIFAKGFATPTFNWADLVKISNPHEIGPKSTYFDFPEVWIGRSEIGRNGCGRSGSSPFSLLKLNFHFTLWTLKIWGFTLLVFHVEHDTIWQWSWPTLWHQALYISRGPDLVKLKL